MFARSRCRPLANRPMRHVGCAHQVGTCWDPARLKQQLRALVCMGNAQQSVDIYPKPFSEQFDMGPGRCGGSGHRGARVLAAFLHGERGRSHARRRVMPAQPVLLFPRHLSCVVLPAATDVWYTWWAHVGVLRGVAERPRSDASVRSAPPGHARAPRVYKRLCVGVAHRPRLHIIGCEYMLFRGRVCHDGHDVALNRRGVKWLQL